MGSAAMNKGAWLYGVNDLRVENYDTSRLVEQHEVRVKLVATGICGSDVHYLKHMQCGPFVVKEPMVIGHESAGVIVEVGSGVEHLSVGDKVAMEPGISCLRCSNCIDGRYNLCPDMAFFATPPIHGSLAQYVIHPARLCFKLPLGMNCAQGAMCEPVSVAIHACRRVGVTPGKTVCILGSGPIGLLSLSVSKAFGATRVVVTDVSSERLKIAEEIVGCHATVSVGGGKSNAEVATEVIAALGGEKADVTLDCAGFESTMRSALLVTKNGGRVGLVGMGQVEMKLPMAEACQKEIDVVGVFRYANTYPTAIELISSGKVNVLPLISHKIDVSGSRFTSEALKSGFELSANGGRATKVMFIQTTITAHKL